MKFLYCTFIFYLHIISKISRIINYSIGESTIVTEVFVNYFSPNVSNSSIGRFLKSHPDGPVYV